VLSGKRCVNWSSNGTVDYRGPERLDTEWTPLCGCVHAGGRYCWRRLPIAHTDAASIDDSNCSEP